jgi:hypothetical protein
MVSKRYWDKKVPRYECTLTIHVCIEYCAIESCDCKIQFTYL